MMMRSVPEPFRHPYDTALSSGLRFLVELIAWVTGPWAIAAVSAWLVLPALVVLVGVPAVFSTPGDKNNVVVATPGPIRVGIELLLYGVAALAPWIVWPAPVASACTTIVAASIVKGVPRMKWLLRGGPIATD